MRLVFGSLVLDNFKAFAGVHVFDMREFGDGLHFLRGRNDVEPRLGSNGAGKSSLWHALTWCLYGKTADGLKNPDLRPWHGKGSTRVGIGVSVGKEKYTISRSIAPNRISIDRRECGQEDIEKLIGLDFDLFTNTVLLGQGRPLFFDLQPRDKMDLFVNALQLNRWDARADRASVRVKTLSETINTFEGELQGLKIAQDELDGLIKSTEQKIDTWQDENADLIASDRKELKPLEKSEGSLRTRHGKADLDLEAAETELRHYKKSLIEEEECLLDADRDVQATEYKLERHNDFLHGLNNELTKAGNDVCPACGQPIKDIKKHRAHINAQIKELEGNHSFDKAWENATAVAKKCETAVNLVRATVKIYEGKANDARDSLETTGKELAQVDARIVQLKKSINERERTTNPHKAALRELRKRRNGVVTDVENCVADIVTTRKKAERARFWIKGFKDVRLYVLEEVLQELEMETNAMVEEAGLVGWRVSFTIERETARGSISRGLNIMIRSPRSSGDVKWESWSGGEAQRLRIVGALALSEVLLNHAGVRPNMEALDEPTQHLSGEGVTDLCEYLSDRAARLKKQIWYIDHRSIESTRFSTVTTIIRDKRGSRIEYT